MQDEIIDLNIGGTHKISTSRKTLTSVKDSSLAAMFSGRYPLTKHNGRVFIDRDGDAFCTMLSFLRTGRVPMFGSQTQEHAFYDELDYWMVPSQGQNALQSIGFGSLGIDLGEMNTKKQSFDPDWCANTLVLSNDCMLIKKTGQKHGIVFCSTPLDIFTSYIEFNVQVDAVFGGKSHLFVGMVDIGKQRQENLTSTFWKDSPSSIYWDVWNLKLVSIDEKGQQSGTVFGYGCKCEDKVTKIGIHYDARTRSVSFYKNGVNQGVAFTNIPSGMRPSLDVWFLNGSIEISSARFPGQKKPLKCNL